MKRFLRRLASIAVRFITELLPPTTIAAVALVEPASSGERIVYAIAICLVASMWASSEYAAAEAKADKETAKLAVGLLSRLTNGDSTELNVTITHRTATAPDDHSASEATP